MVEDIVPKNGKLHLLLHLLGIVVTVSVYCRKGRVLFEVTIFVFKLELSISFINAHPTPFMFKNMYI